MADLEIRRPTSLDVLPAGYGPLFDRAIAVLAGDARVRAVWLSGSLARGDGDASSDLDLLVAVADEAFAAFTGGWRDWLAEITSTVLAREIPFLPGSIYTLTPTCERLDIVSERASSIPTTMFRTRSLVFDRDGLDALVPPPPEFAGPDLAKVETAIEEPLRYLALLPEVLARGELLVSQEGYWHLRRRIFELFVEANGPMPMAGAKRWRTQLTDHQHEVLLALPSPRAIRDELIAAHRTIAIVFLAEARAVAAKLGVPWPTALEAAVRAHLERELGLVIA